MSGFNTNIAEKRSVLNRVKIIWMAKRLVFTLPIAKKQPAKTKVRIEKIDPLSQLDTRKRPVKGGGKSRKARRDADRRR